MAAGRETIIFHALYLFCVIIGNHDWGALYRWGGEMVPPSSLVHRLGEMHSGAGHYFSPSDGVRQPYGCKSLLATQISRYFQQRTSVDTNTPCLYSDAVPVASVPPAV